MAMKPFRATSILTSIATAIWTTTYTINFRATSAFFNNVCTSRKISVRDYVDISIQPFALNPFHRDFSNINNVKNLGRGYHSNCLLQASSPSSFSYSSKLQRGELIQVEVTRFGILGASVDIVGVGGHVENYLISEDDPPLGSGLILQSEISYFRRKRSMLDVVVGEILPAYVENVREMENGTIKVDVSLRPPGNAKTMDLAKEILQKLENDSVSSQELGILEVGDKSTPAEIDAFFPGASKSAFKKAVSSLYKKGIVKPAPYSITLMRKK